MDSDLISDLTNHIDGSFDCELEVGNCNATLTETIEAWDVPMDIKRLFQWNWFNAEVDGLSHYLMSVEQIVAEEDLERFMADGLLQIGSCQNGDMVAVDLRDERAAVHFVSHDELWEDDGPSPRGCAVLIHRSLAEFLLRLAEQRYIPIDSCSGDDYRRVVDEMTGGCNAGEGQ